MGINKSDCEILFYSKICLGASFERTLTLGRQRLYASKKEIKEIKSIYDSSDWDTFLKLKFNTKYADPLFKLLGANQFESLDYSDFEGATIVHDLNKPIPNKYQKRYSSVIDFGTIEHVFNFPVAIKNCMDCLETGGFYIGITPANNLMGHGFYQFSPELYYRILSPENGFNVLRMFIRVGNDLYNVIDPKVADSRIELTNSIPTLLIVIAKKSEIRTKLITPQQSDYATAWDLASSLKLPHPKKGASRVRHMYRRIMPMSLKVTIGKFLSLFRKNNNVDDENLGTINPQHFEKVELLSTWKK